MGCRGFDINPTCLAAAGKETDLAYKGKTSAYTWELGGHTLFQDKFTLHQDEFTGVSQNKLKRRIRKVVVERFHLILPGGMFGVKLSTSNLHLVPAVILLMVHFVS